jgi:D-threo-aldose 1-dehydrogenase
MPRHSELVNIAGTELNLSKLSFGTAPIAGLYRDVPEAQSNEALVEAMKAGINYFDAAPLYGVGLAEKRLGKAIKEVGHSVNISTKVGRLVRPGENLDLEKWPTANPNLMIEFDHSPDGILRSIEESIERLGGESIQIVYIHDCDDWVDDALNIVYPVLDKLRSEGVIKAIGVGLNFPKAACEVIKEVDLNLVLIAGRYTLLDQSAQDELLPLILKRNVQMVAAGVYNSGILANPVEGAFYDYDPAPNELLLRAQKIQTYLQRFGIPLKAAAIQFPLRHPGVATVLSGIASRKELEENIKHFDFDIPEEVWRGLEVEGFINPIKL